MKKILALFFLGGLICLAGEATIKYKPRGDYGSYIVERRIITEMELNSNEIENACKYSTKGIIIYFNEAEFREYYDGKLKDTGKKCNDNELDLKDKIGSYVFRNSDKVLIYDKSLKKNLSVLQHEKHDYISFREKDDDAGGYEYGSLLNNGKFLFKVSWRHDNYMVGIVTKVKNGEFELKNTERQNFFSQIGLNMKKAKQNPGKEIKFEY